MFNLIMNAGEQKSTTMGKGTDKMFGPKTQRTKFFLEYVIHKW